MANPGTPTFDQLRIFLAIVDTGSFAAAGRKLNRAVSVISYGIGNLEAQLGLTLFEREGTHKPRLTLAGRAAALGEPIVSYFRPDEIEKKLGALGFTVAANLAGPELGRLYAGGASALDNAAVGHVLHAVHPPSA